MDYKTKLREALAGLDRGDEDLRDLSELVHDKWPWEDAAAMDRVIQALRGYLRPRTVTGGGSGPRSGARF